MSSNFKTNAMNDLVQRMHDAPEKITRADCLALKQGLPVFCRALASEAFDYSPYEQSRIMTNTRHYAAKRFGFHYPETPQIPNLPKKTLLTPGQHNGLVEISTNLTRVFGA